MVPLSVATACLSAFLAFAVEPLVGRLLLPTYGGAAAVWTTALVFFQGALLLGYAVAHVLIRWLGVRRAAFAELGVVALPLLALPVALPVAAAPPDGWDTAAWLLEVLIVTVGAPFVALATATPTLQRWLAAAGGAAARHGAFRLFAAANVGSLVGLLAYPTLIEPNLDLDAQARLWAAGYVVFGLLVAVGVVVVARRVPLDGPRDGAQDEAHDEPPTWRVRLGWIALAAIPAGAVVGSTARLTIDVAAVPLLWVVPLAIYLVTFVLAFAGRRPIGARLAGLLLPPLVLGVVISLFGGESVPLGLAFAVVLGALACAGVVCHARLAAIRPAPERLTEYDLAIAAGGALGGLLAGLVAPLILPVPIEGAIALVLALVVRHGAIGPAEVVDGSTGAASAPVDRRQATGLGRLTGSLRRTPFLAGYAVVAVAIVMGLAWLGVQLDAGVVLAVLILGLLLGLVRWPIAFAASVGAVLLLSLVLLPPSLLSVRTFYGERRVVEDGAGRHGLLSGTTIQGIQHYRQLDRRDEPIGYYHRGGPLADVVEAVQAARPVARIQVVGLGVGALAAYGRATDAMTFYEIDPAVVTIARDPRLFTYLADSAASIDVVVGDGRLGLAAAQPGTADLVVIDAFSSDAIPVHLLTREAIELDLARLRPGGVIAFNVSNRYVDLEPVLAAAVRELGLAGLARVDDPPPDDADADSSHVVVIARDPADLEALTTLPGWRALAPPAARAWTDRWSDLLGALIGR